MPAVLCAVRGGFLVLTGHLFGTPEPFFLVDGASVRRVYASAAAHTWQGAETLPAARGGRNARSRFSCTTDALISIARQEIRAAFKPHICDLQRCCMKKLNCYQWERHQRAFPGVVKK